MLPSMSALLLVFVLLATSGASTAAPLPAIRCAKGDPGMACLVNPCRASSCKPKPNYACLPNYCNNATTYLGNKLPASPCSAVWINTKTKKKVACPPPVGACVEVYVPVCGANKKTYSNKCFAEADGVKVAFSGPCILPPSCTKKYVPVCSKAKETWPSACSAEYNGVKNYTSGACAHRPGPCKRIPRCVSPAIRCRKLGPCGKKKAQYGCRLVSFCRGVKHVLEDGSRASVGVCQVLLYNKATGFPAAACPLP